MSVLRAVVPAAASACPSEQELAAASLSLLAQPALWQSLSLPAPSLAAAASSPWTVYWATRLDASLAIAEARQFYEACHATMQQRQDDVGELLCIAAVIESFYVEEAALDPLDVWVAHLQARLPAPGAWPSSELEAFVIACGIGIILRDQAHPLLATWAERGVVLVRRLKPGPARLKLATFLLQYHLWRGEFSRTSLIVDALPGLDPAGLLPGEAMVWLESVASHARFAAQHRRGYDAVEAALRLVRTYGLREHRYALHAHGAALALAAEDAATAKMHLDAMRPVLDRAPQADQTHYWHFHAGLSLLNGDVAKAVELARAALQNSGEIGGPYRSASHRLSLGQTLLQAGEPAAALPELEQAERIARGIDASLLAFSAALMACACLLQLGQTEDAVSRLASVWAEGARRDYRTTAGWWLPAIMTRLAQVAVERDIESAYVRRLARQRALPGPDPALERWPWPLVLRGFGDFTVTLNDAPLARSGGKTAQRPLDLLRALLAHGPTPQPVTVAMQWLWPDAEPGAQRKAFDVALLRLRRLVDDPRLIHLEGGRLWLDESWTWSDVGALHALMQRVGSAHGATLEQLQRWSQQLLDLMRGPFLAGEEADWVLAARERYRQRFVVTVAQLAAHMEPLDPQACIRLYQRALDVEPLAESLSRRLMRLHAARGDHAEALRVWRTCSTMLLVSAGLGPSRETQALAAELGLTRSDR